MADLTPVPPLEKPISSVTDYALAVVKDGVVFQTMNVDGQLAALLLASPTFVQINLGDAWPGDLYDAASGTFTTPPAEDQVNYDS